MTFYTYEIGHILHVQPDTVGELTPGEMMAALALFDGLYRRG